MAVLVAVKKRVSEDRFLVLNADFERYFSPLTRSQRREDSVRTWHDLRHTLCSRLIMSGVDLKTAQTLMGHKTISMTARPAAK